MDINIKVRCISIYIWQWIWLNGHSVISNPDITETKKSQDKTPLFGWNLVTSCHFCFIQPTFRVLTPWRQENHQTKNPLIFHPKIGSKRTEVLPFKKGTKWNLFQICGRFVAGLWKHTKLGKTLTYEKQTANPEMFSFCQENLGKEIYSKGAGSWKKRRHFQASSSTLLVVVLISRIETIFGQSWYLKFLLLTVYSGREKKKLTASLNPNKNTRHPSCSWSKIH